MRVGLIDVDGHGGFPNYALMHLSAWHKAQGDTVEWYQRMFSGHMDRVYMSKVFTFSKDYPYPIDADEVIKGGTGYKLYDVTLTEEQEHMFPDYSIYPDCDHAIGFLTRGCIRNCPWCVVPKKEGYIRAAATWEELKRSDSRDIVFLDNNVLACDHGLQQIEELGTVNVRIDFNQGMDARLIDPKVARMLAKCKWIKFCRMSCDTSGMLPIVEQAYAYLKEAGFPMSRMLAYALIQDVEESHARIMKLKDIGFRIFAQPYVNFEDGSVDREQKRLARWVNHKAIFNSCTFEEYKG